MVRFLLDTNSLSELIRNPRGLVASRLDALTPEESVCTSMIVAAELPLRRHEEEIANADRPC